MTTDDEELPISAGPHYEVHSADLAAWMLSLGSDQYWVVDRDPLLSGQVGMPAPAEKIAPILVWLNRLLLVRAKGEANARGQRIDAAKLEELTELERDRHRVRPPEPMWANNRFLTLCWKDRGGAWELSQDCETTLILNDPETAALLITD